MIVNTMTIYSVTPNASGTRWVARAHNLHTFAEEYQSKEIAFAAARVRARGNEHSQVLVYAQDGSVESTRAYGMNEGDL